MNIINGDLIELVKEGKFDAIVHGCNCFNTMGAGVAKQIKNNFKEAYLTDKNTKRGDRGKLGTYSHVKIKNIVIINAYTQYFYGQNSNLDYNALRDVFKKIKRDFSGMKIAFPKIGSGLGGGDWYKISKIIETELVNEDITLVLL
tara:strand:- start:233 stop:667 length:435 start_codon:yes stop_codon:yes gene_type:complete